MSCKCLDTNGSLCFNAAAGCISRHQLVQFHNRMGPGAQWGLRCTMWQHKCHNFSFLTVQYFIPGQQFVPVWTQNWGRAHLLRTVSGCWTVHFSRQIPQWGKSLHPNRSCWEAILTQPWHNGLHQMGTAVCPFTQTTIQSLTLQHSLFT